MIELGKKYKDNITGFEGIAVARTDYLYGCVRILIEPLKLRKDGDFLPDCWFDEQRLIALKGKTLKRKPTDVGGSDKVPPSRDAIRF